MSATAAKVKAAAEQFAEENELPTNAPALYEVYGKPAIQLPGDGRPLGAFAADLGEMLARQNIFARKGCAFTLDAEGMKLEPATATWLRSWVEQHLTCYKVRSLDGRVVTFANTMTDDAARVVLTAPQFLARLRPVERFHPCRMPVIRKEGAIELLPHGHDAGSMTYTAPGEPYPLNMPAAEAVEVIKGAFAEFPFADSGRSQSVAIAAMLTVYAGGIMPTGSNRPVFIYLGNAEGCGKTTCARVAGVAYGAVAAEAAPGDETEWQKKLLSAVIGARRLLLLDNLKGHLNSPALECYTTSSRFAGRILGVSKEFSGEACATVLITGNRLTISPDMRRRSLLVELFQSELRAEDRQFRRRLDDPALLELRPRLLAACWALVREWDAAGRPCASRSNSSFPRWCDTIGGIVEHAGFACPTAPAEVEGMADTDTRDITKLAQEMTEGYRYTFADLANLAAEHGLFERHTNDREKTKGEKSKGDDTEGELSRSAKSAFAMLLKQYDRRLVSPGLRFTIEGAGKSRRYFTRE